MGNDEPKGPAVVRGERLAVVGIREKDVWLEQVVQRHVGREAVLGVDQYESDIRTGLRAFVEISRKGTPENVLSSRLQRVTQ